MTCGRGTLLALYYPKELGLDHNTHKVISELLIHTSGKNPLLAKKIDVISIKIKFLTVFGRNRSLG